MLRAECDLCPHGCRLLDGDYGLCQARRAEGGQVVSVVYGHLAAAHVDPIEKKPLHHFYPGSDIYSVGSTGCNLRCRGCQNASLSRARAKNQKDTRVAPKDVIDAALLSGCSAIAYTYNEPIVWSEFVIDCAALAREHGLKNVLVTAGYINEKPREKLFANIDAANVDLKGFSEAFYRYWTGASLGPVLDTIRYLHEKPDFWLELTTLLIPGQNDADADLERQFAWIFETLGPNVPLHLSAFFPAHLAQDIAATTLESLKHAKKLALNAGLNFVYLGNVAQPVRTYCSYCQETVILRLGHSVDTSGLEGQNCRHCQKPLPGVFH